MLTLKTRVQRLELPNGVINFAKELMRLKDNPPTEAEQQVRNAYYEHILVTPDANPELVKLIKAAKAANQ